MKTPYLLDIPASNPSKKDRIASFKSQHGIETHNAGPLNAGSKWMAVWMTEARKLGYGVTDSSDLFDVCSKVCRLLDEGALAEYGATEREAIYNLCRQNGIPAEGLP